MAWFGKKSSAGATDTELRQRMPPVTEPSETELLAERARELRGTHEHWTHTQVFSYLELLRAGTTRRSTWE